MKKMFIFSDGGLGNRLNSLLGGLIAAEITNSTPIICWPINNWCGCDFKDLFETDYEIRNDNIHTIFAEDQRHYLIHDNQTSHKLINVYEHTLDNVYKLKNEFTDIVYFHNKIPSYFSQQQIFENIKKLRIKADIKQATINFCKSHNVNKNTKGIHLRKTDHGRQLDSEQIFSQIQKDRKHGYFVCSDDQATEEQFNTLKNVCVLPKTSYVEKLVDGDWHTKIADTEGRIFPYNVNRSAQSVIEAFADLLILSRTTISVRNKSSFLGWAKLYSNIENL